MRKLIAVSSILFENRDYNPGDELPVNVPGFVETWIENGAAVWKDDEKSKKVVKARQKTAEPGLPGDAYPSAGMGQDLAGKLPARKARGIQPEPSKGRKKSNA